MKEAYQKIKFFIGWPLSLLAIYFIYKLISSKFSDIIPNILHSNFYLLTLSLLSFILYYFIRAYIWQELIQNEATKIPLKHVSFYWAISEAKRYIPGNVWSFLGRVNQFERFKLSNKKILTLMYYEIQLILLSSVLLSLLSLPIAYIFFHITINRSLFYSLATLLVTLIALLTVCGKAFTSRISSRFLLPYSKTENFRLLALYSVAFLLYGIGTYFSIVAILPLTPRYFFEFCGFFTSSLLIGYVTLITPTGLGVREAVTTAGLSLFLPTSSAALASLFSRLMLIIGELLFIGIAFLWHKSKTILLTKVEKFVSNNKQLSILCFLFILFVLYFSVLSILRYNNFYTGRFDLGNMDQAVWNTAHGRIFQITDPNGTDIISRLAYHADFLLILFAPFYYIWSDPRMLLLLQTVIVGIGSFYLYFFAQSILKNKNLALLIAFTYLMYSPLENSILFDFHAVTVATTFLIASFYYLEKKKYIFFSLFLILACLSKEEIWLIASLFGLYILLKKPFKKIGFIMTVVSFAIFYFLVDFAIPHSKGTQHFALSYYSDFGDKPSNVIRNILLNPIKTFGILFQQEQLSYVFKLLLPLGFLPLLFPAAIIFAAPDLLIDLLSNNSNAHQIYYQYTAPITPFLFIASIYGVFHFLKKFPKIPPLVIGLYLFITTIFSAYTLGPLPQSLKPNIDMLIKPLWYAHDIDKFLSQIPKSYSIAATNNLGSHLSRRQKIFTIPVGVEKADIVAFLLNDPFAQPSLKQQKAMAEDLKTKEDDKYTLLYEEKDFIVFTAK